MLHTGFAFKYSCIIITQIDVAQDRSKWRGFVNTVMKLRVPYNAEILLTS
jgi:hypothetical protein